MSGMTREEYAKLFPEDHQRIFGLEEPDPEEEAKELEERDWGRRVMARGYLIDERGQPWRVPDDLVDLYREKYPDLGEDLDAGDDR